MCEIDGTLRFFQRRFSRRPRRFRRIPFDALGEASTRGRRGPGPRRTKGAKTMRFMVIVKGGEETEGGALPDEATLAAMTKYNEELAKAGVLLDLAGLQPTSKGARVTFSQSKPTVTDGPFAEAKELIAGYWLIDVRSKDEAIEWVK